MRKLKVTELSLIEAFFTSLVVGLAETYFPAFSLMKGASPIQAGVLVSLPMIFAVLFQWVLLKKFRHLNLSTWVPIAAGIQLVSLVGLTYLSTIPVGLPVVSLLILYSIYWAGFYSAIPAWNRWISDLVSFDQSQKYFASRTRLTQIGILIGLLLGGFLLQFKKSEFPPEFLFSGLFAVCALFKFITYKLFRGHTKSLTTIHFEKEKAWDLYRKHMPFFNRYILFNFSVYFSSPFVASYLLSDRNLPYVHYMWVIAALFVGKIAMTLVLSQMKRDLSAFKMLIFGALVSAPLPILWSVCVNLPMMISLQLVSGFAWSFWEVGLSLSFFKNLKPDEKIELVSIYYFFSVVTQVAGAIVGAILLKFVVNENYVKLFIIAGIIRFIFALGLRRKEFGSEIASA